MKKILVIFAVFILFPMWLISLQIYSTLFGTSILLHNSTENDVYLKNVKVDGIYSINEMSVKRKRAVSLPMSVFANKPLEVDVVFMGTDEILSKEKIMTCKLDNRHRPCAFEIYLHENSLTCSDCENF